MAGTEDILVLLHPFPVNAGFWEPLAALLPGLHIEAPQFPGFADDPLWIDDVTLEQVADLVAERIDRLGNAAVVCGLSMGGYTALALVDRHPELVRGLALANTHARADSPEGRRGRDQGFDTIRIDGLDAFLNTLVPKLTRPDPPQPVVDELWRLGMQQRPAAVGAALMAMRDRPDRTAELGRIAVPTVVIAGAQDQVTPVDAVDELVGAIPGAQKVVIADAGHMTALEQPAAFADAIQGLLRRLHMA